MKIAYMFVLVLLVGASSSHALLAAQPGNLATQPGYVGNLAAQPSGNIGSQPGYVGNLQAQPNLKAQPARIGN